MIDPSQLRSPSSTWYRRLWLAIWHFLIGRHGFDLEKSTRNRIGLTFLGLAVVISWCSTRALQGWEALRPDPDSPAWELALQARLMLARARVAVTLFLLAVALALLAFSTLDRTRLGKRLWHWSPGMDSEISSAAKTLVAGVVFVGLMLLLGQMFAQVLR